MTTANQRFELGTKLRDRVSGFTGIACSRTIYLNNCDRYSLQPQVGDDGKLPETQWFDENVLELVDNGIAVKADPLVSGKTGGPMPVPKRSDAPRGR